jgi:hypothetical protein
MAIDITQPDMILMRDGVTVSRHRSPVEAMERAAKEGPGVYTLVRPDATIVVSGEVVEPDPEPEPEPEPEPDPEPEPGTKPAAIRKAVNEAALLNFDEWNGSSRYTRATRLTVWRTDVVSVAFDCQDLSTTGGGGRRPLEGTEYTLFIDGVAHTATRVQPGDKTGTFSVVTTGLATGWHVLDLSEFGEETSVPYPVFVLRGELPVQDWVPVFTGSHEIDGWFHLDWVPAVHDPKEWTCPRREFPHFSEIPGDNSVFLEMLTGGVTGHARRLNRNRDGILSTATKQDYFWSDFVAKLPVVELLDGPRGRNVLTMATHIEIATAAPVETGPIDNLYVLDPWRVTKVRHTGEVVTLAGYRHKSPPTYWEDDPQLELVGNWDAIPVERRGFHELWGMCWDSDTFAIDESQPRIPSERNLHPHFTGVVMFVADSQNNRVCKLEFSPTSHAVPPTITEHILAPDCWDCVEWRNEIIVSVRGEHRISAYDKKTGALIRHIVQGAALATVDRNRQVQTTGTLDERRAEDVVAPEGLYVLGDWLYYGSAAQEQVRRVHLVDGRIEVVIPHVPGRGTFLKIAVSDGTTGPEGTVFVSQWDVGAPDVYTPDGSKWSLTPYDKRGLARGRGGRSAKYGYSTTSYSSAVACGNGRVVFGSAMEGLRQISMALPDDPDIDRNRYSAGREKWVSRGHYLTHGDHGESFFGLPLPQGDPDIDYYLSVLGH